MRAETQILIRFADCDLLGHTNNAKYFTYMEQARVALFKKIFSKPHFPFILAEISCRFLAPTYMDEILIVTATIVSIGNSSFKINYEFTNKDSGVKVADGTSAQVWYDYETHKSKPIPEEMRKKLSS
ncbi:MAG: thioesterase family protein [Deltaproteobacteria bacterium]|nr:thioesterase family protein [Deltaproteobacteria bacterium]